MKKIWLLGALCYLFIVQSVFAREEIRIVGSSANIRPVSALVV